MGVGLVGDGDGVGSVTEGEGRRGLLQDLIGFIREGFHIRIFVVIVGIFINIIVVFLIVVVNAMTTWSKVECTICLLLQLLLLLKMISRW